MPFLRFPRTEGHRVSDHRRRVLAAVLRAGANQGLSPGEWKALAKLAEVELGPEQVDQLEAAKRAYSEGLIEADELEDRIERALAGEGQPTGGST